jgi:hypothetical protein
VLFGLGDYARFPGAGTMKSTALWGDWMMHRSGHSFLETQLCQPQ